MNSINVHKRTFIELLKTYNLEESTQKAIYCLVFKNKRVTEHLATTLKNYNEINDLLLELLNTAYIAYMDSNKDYKEACQILNKYTYNNLTKIAKYNVSYNSTKKVGAEEVEYINTIEDTNVSDSIDNIDKVINSKAKKIIEEMLQVTNNNLKLHKKRWTSTNQKNCFIKKLYNVGITQETLQYII